MDMRIEHILLPSSDIDRTKAFNADRVGFVLDPASPPLLEIRR